MPSWPAVQSTMRSTAPAAAAAAAPPASRSPAKERRLRQRRSDARSRLKLLADCQLLAGHHASHVPGAATCDSREFEVADLRCLLAKVRRELALLREEVAGLRAGRAPAAVDASVAAEVETQAAAAAKAAVEAVAAKERDKAAESEAEAAVKAVEVEEARQVLWEEERKTSSGKRARPAVLAGQTAVEAKAAVETQAAAAANAAVVAKAVGERDKAAVSVVASVASTHVMDVDTTLDATGRCLHCRGKGSYLSRQGRVRKTGTCVVCLGSGRGDYDGTTWKKLR